jgi:hypothetical protein
VFRGNMIWGVFWEADRALAKSGQIVGRWGIRSTSAAAAMLRCRDAPFKVQLRHRSPSGQDWGRIDTVTFCISALPAASGTDEKGPVGHRLFFGRGGLAELGPTLTNLPQGGLLAHRRAHIQPAMNSPFRFQSSSHSADESHNFSAVYR